MATTYNGHDITSTSIMGGFDISKSSGGISFGGVSITVAATANKFSFYVTSAAKNEAESCTLGRAGVTGTSTSLSKIDLFTPDKVIKAGITIFYSDSTMKTAYKGGSLLYYETITDAAVKIGDGGNVQSVTDCGPYSLGYSTIGATGNVYFFDSGVACLYTPFRDGTVTSGAAYLIDTNYPGIPGVNLASIGVYADDGGTPGAPTTLLGYSESQSPTATAAWINFTTFTDVGGLILRAGVPVWIAIWSNAPGVVRGYRDAGATNQLSENTTATQIYPDWRDWQHVAYQSNKLSLYLTITP
jgi:hypothetical protein